MRNIVKVVSIVAAFSLLSGCASLSKEECLIGNWEAIGFSDGAAGRTATRLTEHSKACAKASIAPDYQMWEKGRQQGLKQYCTEANAYKVGKNGTLLNSVCPASITPILQRINVDGLDYHKFAQQITTEKAKLKKYQDDYKRLRDGDNLDFADEKEARIYLLSLPRKVRISEEMISNAQRRLVRLERQYGY